MARLRTRYICNTCGSVFDEPVTLYERANWLTDKPMIPCEAVCPDCGGDDWEEAYSCGWCEEDFAEVDTVAGLFCRKCFDQILKERPDIVGGFIEEQKDIFAEYADEYLREEAKKK